MLWWQQLASSHELRCVRLAEVLDWLSDVQRLKLAQQQGVCSCGQTLGQHSLQLRLTGEGGWLGAWLGVGWGGGEWEGVILQACVSAGGGGW
jgi:hypothetical protein